MGGVTLICCVVEGADFNFKRDEEQGRRLFWDGSVCSALLVCVEH